MKEVGKGKNLVFHLFKAQDAKALGLFYFFSLSDFRQIKEILKVFFSL